MDSVKAVVLACLPHPSPPDVSDFLFRGEHPPGIVPDITGSSGCYAGEDPPAGCSGCSAGEDPPAAGSVVHSAVEGAPPAASDVAGSDVRSDQLSSLPEQLCSNIVARLPLRDALGTREISKRWLSVWPSTPLSLDDSDLAGCSLDHRIRAITRILHMHPGPFYSVWLLLTCFEQAKPVLRVWTRILANKGIKELCLVNQPTPIDMDLPLEVLNCATLRRLWVAFFRFPCTSGHFEAYPSLRELGLCATAIEASDLKHMLQSSPVLEMLALVASYDEPMHIYVHSHSSLRCMVLWMSIADEIDVDNTCLLQRLILWKTRSSGGVLTVKIARSPNLRVLGYLEPMLHKLQIGDTIIEVYLVTFLLF